MKFKAFKKLKNITILDGNSYIANFDLSKPTKSGDISAFNRIIIKGNNGCGKSSLSNLFRSIELRTNAVKSNEIFEKLINIHNTIPPEVEIEFIDGSIKYDCKTKQWLGADKSVIRVYSSEYVKENINFENFSKNELKNTFETNEINISIEKKEYSDAEKQLMISNENLKSKEKMIEKAIEKATSEARTKFDRYINIGIKVNNFDNTTLVSKEEYNKVDKKIEEYKKTYDELKDSQDFTPIPTIRTDLFKITDKTLVVNVLNYCEDKIKVSYMDEMLKLTPEIREWKLQGLEYVVDNNCPFCGVNVQNNELVKKYIAYKNSMLKQKEQELKGYLRQFTTVKNELIKIRNSEAEIKHYSNLVMDALKPYQDKPLLVEDVNKAIDVIIGIIETKLMTMSEAASEEKVKEYLRLESDINLELGKIALLNDMIKLINLKMNSAKASLTELRKKIAVLYEIKIRYDLNNDFKEYNGFQERYSELQRNYDIKKDVYLSKLEESKETIKIMKRLMKFMCLGKYSVDANFNLKYKDNDITNSVFILSDGEVSALAFSYFVASLMTELTNEEKKNLIIFIDDPVNSIDYSRIYSFAALIRDLQNMVIENSNISEQPQLFISTHNSVLYNILVQSNWAKKNTKIFLAFTNRGLGQIQETKNIKDTIFVSQLSSIIECAAKSECDITNEQDMYLFNFIRCVIENLSYFVNPQYAVSGDSDSFIKYFDIDDDEARILEFAINHNSHNEPAYQIEDRITTKQLFDACKIIDRIIDTKYPELHHYCSNRNK